MQFAGRKNEKQCFLWETKATFVPCKAIKVWDLLNARLWVLCTIKEITRAHRFSKDLFEKPHNHAITSRKPHISGSFKRRT